MLAEIIFIVNSDTLFPILLPIKISIALVNIIPDTVPSNINKGYEASEDSVVAVSWVLSPNSPIKKARATVTTGPNFFLEPLSSSSSFKDHRANPTKDNPAII